MGIPPEHLPSVLATMTEPCLALRFSNDELTIVGANEQWPELCGMEMRELMRRTPAVCMSPELVTAVDNLVRGGLDGRRVRVAGHRDHRVGGVIVDVSVVGAKPSDTQQFVLVSATPDRSELDAEQYCVAMDTLAVPVLVVGRDLKIDHTNAAADALLAARPGSLRGLDIRSMVHDDARAQLGSMLTSASRAGATAELTFVDQRAAQVRAGAAVSLTYEDQPRVVIALYDLTDQQIHEEALAGLSAVDVLTGLANRQTFVDHIDAGPRTDSPQELVVAFLDLDNFKNINDALGHDQGDEVLQTVARRLDASIGSFGLVGRFGGDEFVVAAWTPPGAGHDELAYLIQQAFVDPVQLGSNEFRISASVGIAATEDPAHMRADTMLKSADLAMYEAKRQGKACVIAFDQSLAARATERIAIESDLRRALENQEFVLHYQPIMDVITGRAVGAEALVRWIHPERGLVPPDHFIPIAEQTGLIVPLGAWVLDHAVGQAATWNRDRAARRGLGISVNLSGIQLGDPELENRIHASLSRHGLDPTLLTLEVTESTLMSDTDETMALLQRFRDLGIGIAIDDFGTGYSSLAYLKNLPAKSLKIDKAFVDGLGVNTEDTSLVTGIVGLASALDLQIVAEGVEAELQLKELRRLGCEYSQGYFHSRPLPAAEFEAWLEGSNGPTAPATQAQTTHASAPEHQRMEPERVSAAAVPAPPPPAPLFFDDSSR